MPTITERINKALDELDLIEAENDRQCGSRYDIENNEYDICDGEFNYDV